MAPIGLEHFFDAFALVHKREFCEAAAEALNISLEEIQPNLVVEHSSARRFQLQLTPICVPDDPPAKLFFARSCLGKVPGGAPFRQRSERATACTIRMQIDKQIDVQDELRQIKQNKLQITNYKLEKDAGRTGRRTGRRIK